MLIVDGDLNQYMNQSNILESDDGKKYVIGSHGVRVEYREKPGFEPITRSYVPPTSNQHIDPSSGRQVMETPIVIIDGDAQMGFPSLPHQQNSIGVIYESKQAPDAPVQGILAGTSHTNIRNVVSSIATPVPVTPPVPVVSAPKVQLRFFTGGIGVPIICHQAMEANGNTLVLVWDLNYPDVAIPEFTPTSPGVYYEVARPDNKGRLKLAFLGQDFVVGNYHITVFLISQAAESATEISDVGDVFIGGGTPDLD
jgi:hypothetical protein